MMSKGRLGPVVGWSEVGRRELMLLLRLRLRGWRGVVGRYSEDGAGRLMKGGLFFVRAIVEGVI